MLTLFFFCTVFHITSAQQNTFSSPSLFHSLPRALEYTFTTYSLGRKSIQGALALHHGCFTSGFSDDEIQNNSSRC